MVGFETTLFWRAKVQPHYAYQPIAKTHMVYIWPEKGVFSYTYTWKIWHLVGFEPTLFGRAKVQPHYAYQPIAKTLMVYSWPEKGVFVIPTPEKAGTWWDLNPHCLGGRRCNHITRISPLAKYPKFGGVTAICRGSMTGKVLTRQLNGKTESGWDLNTRPSNTAKVTLHYVLLCLHQVHQVSCRYCRASRYRYRESTEINLEKHWGRAGFEPMPVG